MSMSLTDPSRAFETLSLSSPFEGLLIVQLNRPSAANSISTTMGHELIAVFGELEAAPETYRCVVLTGAGDRIFCAGADLKEREGMSDEQFHTQHYLFERMGRAVYDCPVPILACVNGAAIAGGLELALACDFIVASDNARFGFSEVSRGIMPGGGGTQQLPRAIGVRRAKEAIFTGDYFGAAEALAMGLLNHVYPQSTLMEETLSLVKRILANAPVAVRQAKKAVTYGMQMDLRTGFFFEIEAYSRLISTEDRIEGIRAFNEKRPPRFIGR
ncbi:enoyl-CoA hydratase-related protein [Bordetella bronchialis]|nr:enoyl-CoA hydratase-related protein [Bordetella bronchialis]